MRRETELQKSAFLGLAHMLLQRALAVTIETVGMIVSGVMVHYIMVMGYRLWVIEALPLPLLLPECHRVC